MELRSIVVVGVVFWSSLAAAQALPPDEMRAHFIDVGQGDATLLEFSCGAVLVDTGGESNGDFESNDALKSYLTDFFARRTDLKERLDLLVLSHPHVDHTRGAAWVVAKYSPRNVVTNGQTTGSGKAGQLAAHHYASATEETPDTADDVGFLAADAAKISKDTGFTSAVVDPLGCAGTDPKLTALWGRVKTNPGWSKGEFDNSNNHSVVLRVDFGAASFLFTGDLETDGIKSVVAKYKDSKLLDADVYKVGHHGAANATTLALLGAVSPKVAVLMNGPKDRQVEWTAWAYGHPRKAIIDMMQPKVTQKRLTAITAAVATGAKAFGTSKITQAIYSTAWDGTVVMRAKADGALSVVPSLIDVNLASVADLLELPGLGSKRANAIVKYRDDHGKFGSVEDLTKVAGIGPATLAMIEDLVTAAP